MKAREADTAEATFDGGIRMAKGRKHYSGKELIYRRQVERQQAEKPENGLKKTVRQVNELRRTVEKAKQRMREHKEKAIND